MTDKVQNGRWNAVRRASKVFLLFVLVISGGLKLMGDAGMVDAFARAGFAQSAVTIAGMIQVGLALLLATGVIDRLVAIAILLKLTAFVLVIGPAVGTGLFPVIIAAAACVSVAGIARSNPVFPRIQFSWS